MLSSTFLARDTPEPRSVELPSLDARLHVGIIMDGNGRWASRSGRSRESGHRAGATAVRNVVEAAPGIGIGTLTLYAFSSDNWRRPVGEVRNLMRLFELYLRREADRCVRQGVRVNVIGRRDRLPLTLRGQIRSIERRTRLGSTLRLHVAVDYSATHAVAVAAGRLFGRPETPPRRRDGAGKHADSTTGTNPRPGAEPTLGQLRRSIASAVHAAEPLPDVDLLIRTGGERRLSDFLLLECAYAELLFLPTLWPDFSERDLDAAVQEFRSRSRRFGGLESSGPPVRDENGHRPAKEPLEDRPDEVLHG